MNIHYPNANQPIMEQHYERYEIEVLLVEVDQAASTLAQIGFAKSIEDFYRDRGYLTQKQVDYAFLIISKNQ